MRDNPQGTTFLFFFIGLKAFASNKRALGRKKDLADLEALGEE